MRILYVSYLDPATTDYPLFLADAWIRLGHEVLLFPPDLEYSSLGIADFLNALGADHEAAMRKVLAHRLKKVCHRFRPDVVLYGGSFLHPGIVIDLRERYNCRVGNIIGYNNLLIGDNARYVGLYDFVFVYDSYLIPLLRGHTHGKNPNVFWKPAIAEPREHCPVSLSEVDRREYGADVAFIGGVSRNRIEALQRIKRYGLRIWGDPHWAEIPELADCYSLEPVYGLKKTKIYNGARIVLNIMVLEKEINSISERVAEGLACGSFVLTEWRPDIDAYGLQDDISIAVYRSLDELDEKIRYYLEHPEERERISRNGRRIVLDSLTYDHCAAKMIEQIESIVARQERR